MSHRVKIWIVIGIVTAGMLLTSEWHRQVEARELQRALNHSLNERLQQLNAANGNLSNQIHAVNGTRPLSSEETGELLQLRGEVGRLRNQLKDLPMASATTVESVKIDLPSDSSSTSTELDAHQLRLLNAMAFSRAVTQFVSRNRNQFPTNLLQVRRYFSEALIDELNPGDALRDIAELSAATNHFDLIYQNDGWEQAEGELLVIRERGLRHTSDGRYARVYAFRSHAEEIVLPDGNFTRWESQYIYRRAK